MKKVAALILSIHFLISGFMPEQNLSEWSKLPSLVQHYYHHTQEHNQTLSFIEFLALLYGDTQHAEEENHDDLPLFNSVCHCLLFVHQENQSLIQAVPLLSSVAFAGYANAYAGTRSVSIFQPPRFS
ncbi:MAG: hypothetical protein ACK45I_07765 [Bacteroidota bacterium]